MILNACSSRAGLFPTHSKPRTAILAAPLAGIVMRGQELNLQQLARGSERVPGCSCPDRFDHSPIRFTTFCCRGAGPWCQSGGYVRSAVLSQCLWLFLLQKYFEFTGGDQNVAPPKTATQKATRWVACNAVLLQIYFWLRE